MKNTATYTFIFTALLLTVVRFDGRGQSKSPGRAATEGATIFPKGQPAPASNFTGKVWLHRLTADDTTFNLVMGSVTFEPGSRSHWHSHPAGQILLVTDGLGYHQERGKPVEIIKKGDVVKCLPNVEHWHGASKNSSMTHVAVNPNTENGVVNWMKPVTDQEYVSGGR